MNRGVVDTVGLSYGFRLIVIGITRVRLIAACRGGLWAKQGQIRGKLLRTRKLLMPCSAPFGELSPTTAGGAGKFFPSSRDAFLHVIKPLYQLKIFPNEESVHDSANRCNGSGF